MPTAARTRTISGLSILVVEDESLIARMIEDTLKDLGCAAVWHAPNVAAALAGLGQRQPDLAVVDVNLTGELAYPVAVRLDEMSIPLVFLTAYDRAQMPAYWRVRPVVNKPFRPESLAAALTAALNDDARA